MASHRDKCISTEIKTFWGAFETLYYITHTYILGRYINPDGHATTVIIVYIIRIYIYIIYIAVRNVYVSSLYHFHIVGENHGGYITLYKRTPMMNPAPASLLTFNDGEAVVAVRCEIWKSVNHPLCSPPSYTINLYTPLLHCTSRRQPAT